MSFGFSVGDFIAAIELANRIRKEFVDAPSQFKDISDEVRSLSIVLQDLEVVLSEPDLSTQQKTELREIADGCLNVLKKLEETLDKYGELKSGSGSVGKRIKRVWKRLKWEPEDIKELRSRIVANVALLNTFQGKIASQISMATKGGVDLLHERQDIQERREECQAILDWLTPIDYTSQQSDFIARRQEGTGTWLLDSMKYQSWRETKKQTLFCPGIPGAGKTIITSIVVEELNTRFRNDNSVGIACIYYNFRRQDEQKIDGLLASLLKQLAESQPSLPGTVKELYNQHKTKRTRPSLEEISRSLQAVTTLYSRVFIIVDALDECQISDGCRQRFLSGLFNLQAKCGANLFATSRPIASIEKEFEGNSKLEIRASEEDVRRYLDGHMFRLPRFVARSLKLKEEIKTNIVNAVDGMFLLAQLHLDSLTGKRSPKAVQTALKNLIRGSAAYDHAYEDAMERINGQIKDQEELAKQVLSWITCAKRPLAIIELQHALGVEIEDILSESGIIRLVHYTTQEYFERTQRQWFPDAQINITTICVSYLSFNEFESGICQKYEEFERRLQLNTLYDYAAHNWGHHAREASIPCQVKASSQALLVDKRLENENYNQDIHKKMTGLHLAAYFGVDNAVQFLISRNNPDLKDSYGRTPLSWAAGNGYETTDKGDRTPLSWAATSGNESKDKDGQTPLSWAATSGNESKDKDGRTPLSWAATSGNESKDKDSRTPLSWAATRWNESKDKDGQTPLSWAARSGNEINIQLLLEKGANIESKDKDGRTPLSWATTGWNKVNIQLLLEKGADIESKDKDDRTPLLWAITSENEVNIQLLLEKGADIESKDKDGRTPLLWAATSENEINFRLLLEKGADIESKDKDGRTPLSWAASSGRKAVVQLLLEISEVDVNSKDSGGQTPLSWAAKNRHDVSLQLLLETDKVNINTKDIVVRALLFHTLK
ncbi:ankyrin repeat-containing domain protein [Leptodontidium sp. MPI-SDFR-AT-0119]|nr:ankyrin repeat-containing domain protein [Leptodontidium sp. MPI-SDFR-AT-0119]